MHYRPELPVILEAVSRWLGQEVRPLLTEPEQAFRVLIAQSLLAMCAAEQRAGDAADVAQFESLRALFGEPGAAQATHAERLRQIGELERRLAVALREGRLAESGPARAHVEHTLRDRLQVSNPRFDLSDDVEGAQG